MGLGLAISGQWGALTVVPEGGRVGLRYVSSVESTENGNYKETSVEQRSPAYVPTIWGSQGVCCISRWNSDLPENSR